MGFTTLILIALGLNFDTFAVSISTGLVANNIKFWQATKVAVTLAIFQALMPVLGWFIGSQLKSFISNYDHWLAFGLLTIVGIKMIIESQKKEEKRINLNPFKSFVIVGMAVATSIDALIVGVSFAFINVNILLSVGVIGFTTYILAMLGLLFGKKAGQWFGGRIEILGGVILIAIGLKILIEHLIK